MMFYLYCRLFHGAWARVFTWYLWLWGIYIYLMFIYVVDYYVVFVVMGYIYLMVICVVDYYVVFVVMGYIYLMFIYVVDYSIEREHVGLRGICGYGVSITRGAASAMMLTYSSLLVTMCRNTITFLRETFLHRFFPFDDAIELHKYIAVLAMIFTGKYWPFNPFSAQIFCYKS